MANNYLALNLISCGYGKSFNLNDISLSVARGAFAGIIGPNGSGKTTLFKGISGILPIKKGSICLSGVPLESMKLREKARKMAVVSQFPEGADMTVQDYVLLGRLPHRHAFNFLESARDKVLARKYMRLTGIYHYREKQMSQLSGGEQQLAAIAQALTQEPELLLLDEPTSHLDINHQMQMLDLIQSLNKELNLTVLMIIHDLNLAAEYCDQLILINDGKIYTQGTPAEVLTFQNIEAVYNAVVIAQTNPLSGKPVIFPVSGNTLKTHRTDINNHHKTMIGNRLFNQSNNNHKQ